MSLHDFQRLYAALLTDNKIRRQFSQDAAGVGALFGLSACEVRALSAADGVRFEQYAESIKYGRLELGFKGLPATALYIAPFWRFFTEHFVVSATSSDRDTAAVVRDATAIRNCLVETQAHIGWPQWLVELAEYELTRLLLSYSNDAFAAAQRVGDGNDHADNYDNFAHQCISIDRNVVIRRFGYDVGALALRKEFAKGFDPAKDPKIFVFIRVLGSPAVKVFRTSNQTFELLRLCEKNVAISDIVERLGVQYREPVDLAIRKLLKIGVLQIRKSY